MLLALALTISAVPAAFSRSALLVAHYGSSDDDTRSKTIDRITADIREALPGMEIREAYISAPVRKKLATRGIAVKSPTEALLALAADGYDTVYVQSTTIIEGTETAEVRRSAELTSQFFDKISVGHPLCYSVDDSHALADIIAATQPEADEAIVFVGHGNNLPGTATYAMLDDMLHADGHTRYHVSTIEGYPTAATTLAELKSDRKIKRVRLFPLLLVCGNHTRHDIAGDFADTLKGGGLQTEVVMQGLAENEAVRKLYVQRTLRLISE